jgi:hypothetical protein
MLDEGEKFCFSGNESEQKVMLAKDTTFEQPTFIEGNICALRRLTAWIAGAGPHSWDERGLLQALVYS